MRNFATTVKRALPVLVGILFLAGPAGAATLADLEGAWAGTLTASNGGQAPLLVHVMADGTGSVDSPALGTYGVPAQDFQLEHNILSFVVPQVNGRFHGMLEGDLEAIDGQWERNGKVLPLRLIRRDAPAL